MCVSPQQHNHHAPLTGACQALFCDYLHLCDGAHNLYAKCCNCCSYAKRMRESVGLRCALISQFCRHNARADGLDCRVYDYCGHTAGFGQFAQNRSKLHNKLSLQRNQAMLASAPGRHSARIATTLAIVTAGQLVCRWCAVPRPLPEPISAVCALADAGH